MVTEHVEYGCQYLEDFPERNRLTFPAKVVQWEAATVGSRASVPFVDNQLRRLYLRFAVVLRHIFNFTTSQCWAIVGWIFFDPINHIIMSDNTLIPTTLRRIEGLSSWTRSVSGPTLTIVSRGPGHH
jgi:hypothetical protein